MMNAMTDMKKDFLERGAEGLRQIRLSPAEKGAALSRLLAHAERHPSPGAFGSSSPSENPWSP